MAILESLIIQSVAHNCAQIVSKKAPLILMTVGIGGMGASTAMAVSVTPKANAIYKQIMRTPNLTPSERNKEIFKRVVPLYAPAALTAVGGATCIIGSYSINMARLAELGAAYAIAQNNLTSYRREVEEQYGKEAEKEIVERTIKREEERAKEAEAVDDFAAECRKSSSGETIILVDRNTGKQYDTTPEAVSDACLYLQHRMTCGEMLIQYSDFETELDPDNRPCNFSDNHGWVAGDIIRPSFSDWYITKKGTRYKEFEIDTNPNFVYGGRKLGDML